MPKGFKLGRRHIPYRSLIVAFEIIGGIVFIAFLAVVIAHMRLEQGPVSLKFLVKPIEAAINKELAGSHISIGDAVVQYDAKKSIRFRLQSVSLYDSKGDVVAQAPRAAIRLSGTALLKGQIAPAIVEFIEPRILLFYSKENGLSLSFPGSSNIDPSGEEVELQIGGGDLADASDITRTSRVSIAKTISEALDIARRRSTASAYLTRFGIRNALVAFEREGRQSYWRVPYYEINMDHQKKRSTISGTGRIVSSKDDWGLDFQVVEFARKDRIEIDSKITDLIPSKLQKNLPYIASIENITTPINANIKITMSRAWDIRDAKVSVNLGAGDLGLPGLKRPPLIKDARLNFQYSGKQGQIELKKSIIRWDDSEAVLTGLATPTMQNGMRAWDINLQADDVKLGPAKAALALDKWQFNGRYAPEAHYLQIASFVIGSENTNISFQGHLAKRTPVPDIEITGKIDPMPVTRLKNLWPAYLLPDAYDWFQDSIFAGDIQNGTVKISTSAALQALQKINSSTPGNATPADAEAWKKHLIRLELDGKDIDLEFLKHMPYLKTGIVKLVVSGQSMIARIAEGEITLPSGRKLSLHDGEVRIADFFPDIPTGQVSFEVKGDALATLELLDHKPLGYVSKVGFKTDAISGKITGNVHLAMPFSKDVEFKDVTLNARLNLEDGSLKQKFGDIKVNGGSIGFGVTEKALEASGDILIDGVPAKLHWQRIFSAPAEMQPPIRITTKLDETDRDQLGLELNHVVRGELPLVLTIGSDKNGGRHVSAQADLTNAELILENMAWRKLPGHTAILEFDIAPRKGGRTELQNFKIVGDNIAIDGWLSLNEKNRLDAFYFPEFSVNLITHLQVEGKLNKQNIWQVKARGTTFDGRNLFKSLFSAGKITERKLERPKDRAGIDLDAEISNLVGFEDTMLRDVKVKMSRRRGKLTALDANGVFSDGKPINVKMIHEPGKPRYLVSETKNAGNAFRLVGFYPSVIGGTGTLRVNMDGEGYAEKTGKLWARNFYIRGDPVVGQVLVNTPDEAGFAGKHGRPAGGRKVKYSTTQFDRLKMSFSVGQGQLVLHEAYINGPLIGATIRGRVDYEGKHVYLGGTYVPLYGLNAAIGEIPLIGPLFRGRRGEGLFGITFLVDGTMTAPNVTVNPISVITPGIFRQIFDMVPQTNKVRLRRPPPRHRGPRHRPNTPGIQALPPQRAGPTSRPVRRHPGGPHPERFVPPPKLATPAPPMPVRRPKMPTAQSWTAETFAN